QDSSAPDVAAARCVLENLRDRQRVRVSVVLDTGSGQPSGDATEIVSFGDGSASVSNRHYEDVAVSVQPSVRRAGRPPSYFEQCLAGDPAAILACTRTLVTNTVVDGATCSCQGNSGTPPPSIPFLSGFCRGMF